MGEPSEMVVQTPGAAASQSQGQQPATGGSSVLAWFVALMALGGVIYFYDLDGGAAMSQTDCWVAQTAREMNEGGRPIDYLVPRFSGELRIHKTPGPYWLVAAISHLTGKPIDAAIARLPNAAFALATVAVIFGLAWRIAGERVAVLSGAVMLTSMYMLEWSHRAASDLGVAFFITASLASFWTAANTPPGRARFWLWMAFYAAFGLGMLYKGPMPAPCVGIPVVGYMLIRRRWRLLLEMYLPIGIVVSSVFWLPWAAFIAYTVEEALAKWDIEFIGRATGALPNVEAHKKALFYLFYVPLVFGYMVPWCFSIPHGIACAFRKGFRDSRDGLVFLVIWFFGNLLFLTAATGKEARYVLVALPPLAILLGCEYSRVFARGAARRESLVRLAAWAVYILAPVGLAAGAFGVHHWTQRYDPGAWEGLWPRYVVLAVIMCVGLCLAARLYTRGREDLSFAAIVATPLVGFLWFWPMIYSVLQAQPHAYKFAAELDRAAPKHANMYFLGTHDARVVWATDRRIPRLASALELVRLQDGRRNRRWEERFVGEQAYEKLVGDEPVLFIAAMVDLDRLRAGLALQQLEAPIYEWCHSPRPHERYPEKYVFVLFGNRPPPGAGGAATTAPVGLPAAGMW